MPDRYGRRVPLVILVVALGVHQVLGSVVFPNGRGRLHGLTLYSPTPSLFLGPQFEDKASAATLDIYVHAGDACEEDQIDSGEVTGKAIILGGKFACSYFQLYVSFARKGAAAIIDTPASDAQPGRFAYWRDGPESDWHRRHPMIIVETDADRDIRAAIIKQGSSTPGLKVTVSVDANEWIDVFASWQYQVFVRWVPTAVFALASVCAGLFLIMHVGIVHKRFTAKVCPERRTARRWFRFVTSKLYGEHLIALSIEMISSVTMAIVIGLTGFYSTSHWTAWVTMFFTMQMTGWALAATFLSSIIWNSRLDSIMPKSRRVAWWPIRVLRGEHGWATVSICLFVILLEVAVDIWFVTYKNWLYDDVPFGSIVSGIFCALEVLLGTNFLLGVVRYLVEVSRTTLPSNSSTPDTEVHRILRRIWWCAGIVGVCMVGVASSAAMVFINTKWFFSPAGWTICWSIGSTARATGSLARVFVFQPRRSIKGEATGRTRTGTVSARTATTTLTSSSPSATSSAAPVRKASSINPARPRSLTAERALTTPPEKTGGQS